MSGSGPEHLEALKRDAKSAGVVVFASRITDVREIVRRLEALGMDHRVVTMAMGQALQRERFHVLEEWTGSSTLPQVFMDGRFIGGPAELFAHPGLQGRAAKLGAWLGYGGLVPFALALGGYLVTGGSHADSFARQFLAYGAVILSFVGAVHWGVALGGGPRPGRRMSLSVIPALVAWAALLLPPAPGALLIAAALVAVRGWEATTAGRRGLPEWYLAMRSRLTGAVALMACVFAVAAW